MIDFLTIQRSFQLHSGHLIDRRYYIEKEFSSDRLEHL